MAGVLWLRDARGMTSCFPFRAGQVNHFPRELRGYQRLATAEASTFLRVSRMKPRASRNAPGRHEPPPGEEDSMTTHTADALVEGMVAICRAPYVLTDEADQASYL